MQHQLKILLGAIVLGLFMVPLSIAVAEPLDTYSLATIEPQTIPLWGPTWDHGNVTYTIEPGKGVSLEAIRMVEQSVDDWNRAIHTRLLTLFPDDSPFHLLVPNTEGKADITIRPKKGGGMVQGQALCKSDGGFFIDCKVNVSGKAFGSDNPDNTVLSIAIQELGHALGLLHSDNLHDVMYGTLQESPNTVISHCDINAWEEVMDWLLSGSLTAYPPMVDSVSCPADGGAPPPADGDDTVVAHVENTIPFTVGKKNELRITHLIHDAGNPGNPVAEATVSVELTLPNGDVLFGKASTGADGEVTFRLRQKAHDGTYILEVTNVEKDGLTYDKCGDSDPTPPDESKVEFEISGGVVVSEMVMNDCP